jgi:hypothetical protein
LCERMYPTSCSPPDPGRAGPSRRPRRAPPTAVAASAVHSPCLRWLFSPAFLLQMLCGGIAPPFLMRFGRRVPGVIRRVTRVRSPGRGLDPYRRYVVEGNPGRGSVVAFFEPVGDALPRSDRSLGSLLTRCWRKPDSNPRSHLRFRLRSRNSTLALRPDDHLNDAADSHCGLCRNSTTCANANRKGQSRKRHPLLRRLVCLA